MYCLDPLHPIFNATIMLVAKHPDIAVRDLHAKLKENPETDISLQHVYRTVDRLLEGQILLKTKGKLSLNALWLSHLQLFADEAQSALPVTTGGISLPLELGKRVTVPAQTLLELETLWNHTLVELYNLTEVKEVYKYYAHAWWFQRAQTNHTQLYKQIAEQGIACYWLYGNDTYLDKKAASLNKGIFQSKIDERTAFPREGYNLNVYGEYILECVFPNSLAKHFSLLFRSIESEKDNHEAVFDALFHQKEKLSFTLWREPKQAEALRAKIARVF